MALAVMEAMAAATIPRGATHAMNALSRPPSSEPAVIIATLSGRTISTSAPTTTRPFQPRARTSSSRTSAASRMNRSPTRRTVS